MKKARPNARRSSRRAPQMMLAFVAEAPLEERVRTEVVALLSLLLLQVAQAQSDERGGRHDRP